MVGEHGYQELLGAAAGADPHGKSNQVVAGVLDLQDLGQNVYEVRPSSAPAFTAALSGIADTSTAVNQVRTKIVRLRRFVGEITPLCH